jgi:hypothetical protein
LLFSSFQATTPMLHCSAPVLFESSDNYAVLQDPANADWVALLRAIDGDRFDVLARRYYLALAHFRKRRVRPALPGQVEVVAQDRQQALHGMLAAWEQRKVDHKQGNAQQVPDVFVDAAAPRDDDLPETLADLSKTPPPLRIVLAGAGRPPCDALCLLRALLAAPLLGVGDDPTSVYRLLRSNPTFAHYCDFVGRGACKQPGELTSRRLPSQSVCEEFSEVMTRYGLWQLARMQQVRDNLATGVLELENTAVFDTTHIEAHSHCANVVPPGAQLEDGQRPKHRKVPRMRKRCGCGRDSWDSCVHPWVPTDSGAAVVVKGPSRIYWAHKASVASFANSEVPFDARACQYAAESDGKTLLPHLELLARDLPEVVLPLSFILADVAYRENRAAVARFGQNARLIVPAKGRKARAALAQCFVGIDRFTPIGVPVCDADHRFEMRGRDIIAQRYIWAAPDDDLGKPVCASCPLATRCLGKGQRRHIRVPRKDQPQIDWHHPQHFARDRARYKKRTGVQRAIKRLKVDLNGEHLTHRDAHRVQAHLDRKLLTLHLLLSVTAFP